MIKFEHRPRYKYYVVCPSCDKEHFFSRQYQPKINFELRNCKYCGHKLKVVDANSRGWWDDGDLEWNAIKDLYEERRDEDEPT